MIKTNNLIITTLSVASIFSNGVFLNESFASANTVESYSTSKSIRKVYADSAIKGNSINTNIENVDNVSSKTVNIEGKKIQEYLYKIKETYPNEVVEVVFPVGLYVTDRAIVLPSDIIISGQANEQGQTTFMRVNNKYCKNFFLNGVEDVAYDRNAGSNITIKNILFKETGIISIGHGKDIVIKNVHVLNMPNGHAIEVNASENVHILNTTFEGVNFSRDGGNPRDFNEIIQLDRNTAESFPHFGRYNDENYNVSNKNVLIKNCTFKPSKEDSYSVAIGSHASHEEDKASHSNVQIINNKFYGAKKGAIRMPHVESVIFRDNEFKDTPMAINVRSSSKYVSTKNVEISNNKFHNAAVSIRVWKESTGKKFEYVTVKNNTITNDAEKTGTYGIRVRGAIDGIKSANSVSNVIEKEIIESSKLLDEFKTLKLNDVTKSTTAVKGKVESGLSGVTAKVLINGVQVNKTVGANENGEFSISIPAQKSGTKIEVRVYKTGYATLYKTITVK